MNKEGYAVIGDNDCTMHIFQDKEIAYRYVELSKELKTEDLIVEPTSITDNTILITDIELVDVLTLIIIIQHNREFRQSISINKKISIDVENVEKCYPLGLFGLYQYKLSQIIPKGIDIDNYTQELIKDKKSILKEEYIQYVRKNKLTNVFEMPEECLNIINDVDIMKKKIIAINSEIIDSLGSNDIVFDILSIDSLLEEIEFLKNKKIVKDKNILEKYDKFIKKVNERNCMLKKYNIVFDR